MNLWIGHVFSLEPLNGNGHVLSFVLVDALYDGAKVPVTQLCGQFKVAAVEVKNVFGAWHRVVDLLHVGHLRRRQRKRTVDGWI